MPESFVSVEVPTSTGATNGVATSSDVAQNTIRATPKITDSSVGSVRELSVERLYADAADSALLLGRALQLLRDCTERLVRAQRFLSDGKKLDSDYEVSLVQGDLPELFCCKSVSESFGVIVLSVYYALENRRGSPLSDNQLSAIRKVIRLLCTQIFMSYEDALDLLDELEEAGLKIDPPEFSHLQSVLLDESDH